MKKKKCTNSAKNVNEDEKKNYVPVCALAFGLIVARANSKQVRVKYEFITAKKKQREKSIRV